MSDSEIDRLRFVWNMAAARHDALREIQKEIDRRTHEAFDAYAEAFNAYMAALESEVVS